MKTIHPHRPARRHVHLELTGRAADLASQAGTAEIALSITHEGGFAAATVVILAQLEQLEVVAWRPT